MNYVVDAPRKQWVETADRRHAVDAPPAHPGDELVSLCQQEIVVVAPKPGRPAPECRACDHFWREIDGSPQRETYIPRPADESTEHERARQLSYLDKAAGVPNIATPPRLRA